MTWWPNALGGNIYSAQTGFIDSRKLFRVDPSWILFPNFSAGKLRSCLIFSNDTYHPSYVPYINITSLTPYLQKGVDVPLSAVLPSTPFVDSRWQHAWHITSSLERLVHWRFTSKCSFSFSGLRSKYRCDRTNRISSDSPPRNRELQQTSVR